MNKKVLGNGMLTLTAIIWGTAFVAQRVGMDSIEPITFNAARMILGAVIVSIVAFFVKDGEEGQDPVTRKEYKRNTLLGGLFCGIFLASASTFQQMGLVYTSAGKAGFITALYIILVPVFNLMIFRKKSSILVWIAVLMGVLGLYFLCVKEGFSLTGGDIMICICALLFSGHILCADYFTKRANPVKMSAIQFMVTALVSTVMAFLLESPSPEKVMSAIIPIAYCGIMSGGLGYTLQLVGQGLTDPVIASLLMSLESVFAVIAGALILHERMSGRELAGCIIMFLAILLVQLPVPTRFSAKKTDDQPNGET